MITVDSPQPIFKVKFTYREGKGSPLVVKETEVSKEEYEQIIGGN